MNKKNHDLNSDRSKQPLRYHLNNFKEPFISALTTAPCHSLSLLSNSPEAGTNVDHDEAIQASGATDSSSDEFASKPKDSPEILARSSVYNYFKFSIFLVKLIRT
ncbi:hypothetical protein O181_002390 [Austropuccinia psidii MF-1]|uniref:Uncharacterized protein n=1 Tax=Austropuccinia psidii MF-1 TaxID=1389203 RepID=A0A9Q3BCY0_9BASI|nr:hypothetical protein [Austropuccinia psidii MF-1]